MSKRSAISMRRIALRYPSGRAMPKLCLMRPSVVEPFSWPITQMLSPLNRPNPPTMASSSHKARRAPPLPWLRAVRSHLRWQAHCRSPGAPATLQLWPPVRRPVFRNPDSCASFLTQRMQVANQAFEPFVQYMGIDLRGRDIGMAEQSLHDAQIGTVV